MIKIDNFGFELIKSKIVNSCHRHSGWLFQKLIQTGFSNNEFANLFNSASFFGNIIKIFLVLLFVKACTQYFHRLVVIFDL